MRVLTIGLDKNALNLKSQTAQRFFDYAGLADGLEIIILGAGGQVKKEKNLTVYPTSANKIKSLFIAYKIGKKVLSSGSRGQYLISTQDPFFTGLIGWLLKRKFRVPLQIQAHIDFFSPYYWRESFKNKINVILARLLLPKADGVRAVSQKIKEYLTAKAKIREESIFVLPVFTDAAKIIDVQPQIDLHKKYPQFDFIILMASRLVKQKNIGLAIAAMRELSAQYPNAGLIIVGSGPEVRHLKDMARGSSNVVFEPWSEDLASYYKTANLFLLPSLYEGWGRTALEAMAAGCPVIMTDVGLAGEILLSGYNGLTCSVNSRQELLDRIVFALEDKKSMEELRTQALETARALPTKQEYLKKYLETWQNCFS